MKTRWLDRRIGMAGPYLALCLSLDEFRAACAHLRLKEVPLWVSENANATMHSMTNPQGDLVCVVCVEQRKGRTPIEMAGLLIHEAVHVWQAWCREVGEREPGSEQEAYAVQKISQELMAEFARRMRRR